MTGVVLSTLLLAMTGSLWLYGTGSLVGMGHYTERDAKSRNPLHLRSQGLGTATQAIGYLHGETTRTRGTP